MKQNITFNHYLRKRIPITMKHQTTQRIPPIKRCNGTCAKSDKEKVEIFGDHLSKVFEPSPSHNECEDIKLLAYQESAGQLDLPILKFNVKDVKSIISK